MRNLSTGILIFNLEFLTDHDNTKATIGEIFSRGNRGHASTENDES